MIIEARVDEILDYVDKELKHIHRSQKLPGGVVLVGGTSKIPGLADFTKEKLGLPTKIGSLNSISGITDIAKDLTFLSAVGLMHLDMIFGNNPEHALNKNNLDLQNGVSIIRSIWSKIKP